MRLSKGLVTGVAICLFSTVVLSSSASAASWFGLFGNSSSGQSSDSGDAGQTDWWAPFKNSGDASPPSPADPEPAEPTDPQPKPPVAEDDADKDGLSAAREAEQKTNNAKPDSDDDGLSDYLESKWNAKRDVLFCGAACAYPDPIKKDIYIEADWMVLPDGTNTQPNGAQVKLLTDAFAKEGINLHVDTGQYGGGNAVPYTPEIWFGATAGEKDFVDYKRGGDGIAPQFKTERGSAWHYMLVGERYKRVTPTGVSNTSSGVANVSGPNIFIAYGIVRVINQNQRDVAVASTMMHELGHNLCLTKRPTSTPCTFAGIDNDDAEKPDSPYRAYRSSMSYLHTFHLVDYSHNPTNNPGDHDDWGAIRLDMFPEYNESANGQSQKTASRKEANNTLENFNHSVSVKLNLGL